MLFNSYEFLFLFLPLSFALCLPFKGQALLRLVTLSSFVFYAFAGHAWFLAPMLFTTAADFFLAPRMDTHQGGRRRAILALSLSLNLGLLCCFKYSRLFFGVNSGLVLPAGISFYTFQTMAYMIDVYRRTARPEKNFWKFAGFVSFFPHLVAGPLTRHDQLIPALDRLEKEGIQPDWEGALFLFSAGLCKKVLIGDAIASYVDRLLRQKADFGLVPAWLLLLGFSLQIYFDFSGYSDMALGLGRLFGVRLPRNFDSPYRSDSPREFWRRWHMTLSRWLRDYLYISLGGNRMGEFRQDLNLMATMLLGGLWHGANWTFVAWGAWHGFWLVVYRRFQAACDSVARPLRVALTFTLMSLGWVFFRAPDFGLARDWFAQLAGMGGTGLPFARAFPSEHLWLGVWVAAGLIAAFRLPEPAEYVERQKPGRFSWALLGLLTAVALSQVSRSSRFLYFQF